MNALLTDLVMTGSSPAGAASGLKSKDGVPGTKRPDGSALAWRTWMIGAPASRHPASTSAIRCSASGLLRGPHAGSSKARWTSIRTRVGRMGPGSTG